MQNQISIFNFNQSQVRVEIHNNEPYFCLKDVAGILNIRNHNEMVAKHLKEKGVQSFPIITAGGKQELTFINESNLYRVIFRSNKPEAVKFQDWIFEEVIPTIRKTGSYEPQAAPKTTSTERIGLRQAISALVSKKSIDYSDAYKLVHHRFNINSIDELTHEQISQAVEYVHHLVLDGEVLDAVKATTVQLEEFELVRIVQFLANSYMCMQTSSQVARAVYGINPKIANELRAEFDRDFPLLKGIAYNLQRFSGSLKDPLCAKEFNLCVNYLNRANLAF